MPHFHRHIFGCGSVIPNCYTEALQIVAKFDTLAGAESHLAPLIEEMKNDLLNRDLTASQKKLVHQSMHSSSIMQTAMTFLHHLPDHLDYLQFLQKRRWRSSEYSTTTIVIYHTPTVQISEFRSPRGTNAQYVLQLK